MKSNTLSIDKEYMELASMSPAEINKWLHDLVSGLRKMHTRDNPHQVKKDS